MKALHAPALLSLLIVTLLARPGWSAELELGDPMTTFSVRDQHEVEYSLEAGVHWLLVSFDMSTGKATNKVLEAKGADYLPGHQAVYLSNIDGMPWVGRKFAFPKMRRYPHRILLADTPERDLLQDFPRKPGHVTVFELDDELSIVSIQFWDPRSEPAPVGD